MSQLFLIVNAGSTSVKTQLFDAQLQSKAVLNADYGSSRGLVVEGLDTHGGKISECLASSHDARATLTVVLGRWRQMIAQDDLSLAAIGHRVVHGGKSFDAATPINQNVLERIAQLDAYAPLHNPLNRLGVTLAGGTFPGIKQFAVFDTAFHRHIPDYASRYAIPEHLSSTIDFYRYGFHGISCQHSLSAAAALLNRDPSTVNLIVLHLGGGASVTAIRGGVSVDTSMGFSPTEGLIMAGRCGDLDPMIPITLQREGMTLQQIDNLLNHQSGLTGICGAADMRTIMENAGQGDERAVLAVEMFCYRIKKYIGAYCAVLGDVTALIFTGGIGEHTPVIREKIVQDLIGLGFSLDTQANQLYVNTSCDVGDQHSRSRILIIPAEEEREIARQILDFPGDNA
ncbi:MAG: acetate/propionate family kinase [Methylococcaceae bacterium]